MKIFLDHCVDRNVRRMLSGHEVRTARAERLDRTENGELLRRVHERNFDLFLTTDKNIRFQHDLDQLPIAVLELNTLFTRFSDLASLEPFLPAALEATRTHRFVSVHADGTIETLSPR